MADVEVTLNSSGNSVKYQGYVLDSCNNNAHVSDGSWSPSSATGMTVSTSGATITITHNNTSTSDVSSTFTWTSSKVSGCSKTLKVTAKGKTVTYQWEISTDDGYSWTASSGYSTTITVDNNFSGGQFVSVAYCPKTGVMDNCAESFTVRNGTNILSRPWGLSDLKNSGNNCATFVTPSGLVTDLKNSSKGSYTISGDIISSLGGNFPISVTYKVDKKHKIIVNVHLTCSLVYESVCGQNASYSYANLTWKFNGDSNISNVKGSGTYTGMASGIYYKWTHEFEVDDSNKGTLINISIDVSVSRPILTTDTYYITIYGGGGECSKLFNTTKKFCTSNGTTKHYYIGESGSYGCLHSFTLSNEDSTTVDINIRVHPYK